MRHESQELSVSCKRRLELSSSLRNKFSVDGEREESAGRVEGIRTRKEYFVFGKAV